MTWAWARATGAAKTAQIAPTLPHVRHNVLCFTVLRAQLLLCHVEEDEPHVLIGNGCSHSHMAHDGRHHARGKTVWRGMAAATVDAEAVLAFHPHRIGILLLDTLPIRTCRWRDRIFSLTWFTRAPHTRAPGH